MDNLEKNCGQFRDNLEKIYWLSNNLETIWRRSIENLEKTLRRFKITTCRQFRDNLEKIYRLTDNLETTWRRFLDSL